MNSLELHMPSKFGFMKSTWDDILMASLKTEESYVHIYLSLMDTLAETNIFFRYSYVISVPRNI